MSENNAFGASENGVFLESENNARTAGQAPAPFYAFIIKGTGPLFSDVVEGTPFQAIPAPGSGWPVIGVTDNLADGGIEPLGDVGAGASVFCYVVTNTDTVARLNGNQGVTWFKQPSDMPIGAVSDYLCSERNPTASTYHTGWIDRSNADLVVLRHQAGNGDTDVVITIPLSGGPIPDDLIDIVRVGPYLFLLVGRVTQIVGPNDVHVELSLQRYTRASPEPGNGDQVIISVDNQATTGAINLTPYNNSAIGEGNNQEAANPGARVNVQEVLNGFQFTRISQVRTFDADTMVEQVADTGYQSGLAGTDPFLDARNNNNICSFGNGLEPLPSSAGASGVSYVHLSSLLTSNMLAHHGTLNMRESQVGTLGGVTAAFHVQGMND